MPARLTTLLPSATALLCALLAPINPMGPAAHGAEVRIQRSDDGRFTLLRDGKPYFIRGAGGSSHLALLREHGGNSIRTWGVEALEQKVDGKPLLDRCAELGITVSLGLWVAHERHGFNYADPAQIRRQRDDIRAAVRKYRSHPALLLWGLGNEMEGPTSDGRAPHIWQELNALAAIVKAEDPAHPVMTVIASAAATKVQGILAHYPNIDVLGVNAYASAPGVAAAVKAAGWKKPFVLAEFGPPGHWETPKTKWGAAIEPSSREKAASYFSTQQLLTEEAADIALGSYCFVWGQKQEFTSTWYGMFLKSGEKLPQVDAMSRAWTGKWPANRCPRVAQLQSELRDAVVVPGSLSTIRAEATDPDGDPLRWEWIVTAESTDVRVGGDKESEPPTFPDSIVQSEPGQAVIRAPKQPGNYRLFLLVRDGKGAASADNFPFRVEARP